MTRSRQRRTHKTPRAADALPIASAQSPQVTTPLIHLAAVESYGGGGGDGEGWTDAELCAMPTSDTDSNDIALVSDR